MEWRFWLKCVILVLQASQTKGKKMNTTPAAYDRKAELAEALANIERIETHQAEMDALRAKYAYASTPEYTARCEAAQKASN